MPLNISGPALLIGHGHAPLTCVPQVPLLSESPLQHAPALPPDGWPSTIQEGVAPHWHCTWAHVGPGGPLFTMYSQVPAPHIDGLQELLRNVHPGRDWQGSLVV